MSVDPAARTSSGTWRRFPGGRIGMFNVLKYRTGARGELSVPTRGGSRSTCPTSGPRCSTSTIAQRPWSRPSAGTGQTPEPEPELREQL